MAQAAQHLEPIGFELLPAAPAMTVATASQLVGQRLVRDRHAVWEPLQDRREGLAVGLTRGE